VHLAGLRAGLTRTINRLRREETICGEGGSRSSRAARTRAEGLVAVVSGEAHETRRSTPSRKLKLINPEVAGIRLRAW